MRIQTYNIYISMAFTMAWNGSEWHLANASCYALLKWIQIGFSSDFYQIQSVILSNPQAKNANRGSLFSFFLVPRSGIIHMNVKLLRISYFMPEKLFSSKIATLFSATAIFSCTKHNHLNDETPLHTRTYAIFQSHGKLISQTQWLYRNAERMETHKNVMKRK